MLVLGIDPGLRVTGFGCLRFDPARPADAPEVVDAGCIRLDERETISSRLATLDRDLAALIDELRPTVGAVEALFSHYKHPRTAITMAHARGVILLAMERAGIEAIELPPMEVKKATTGHGQASKEQMQHAIAALLSLPGPPEPADVADALAIANTAARRVALRSGAALH